MGNLVQTLYSLAPPWLQNLGISAYGLAWRRERLGGNFQQYVEEFRERDGWSRDRLQAYLDAQLGKVLSRAFEGVPYYRRVWQAKGIGAGDVLRLRVSDLGQLPT